jgi:ankyrin repeat protein
MRLQETFRAFKMLIPHLFKKSYYYVNAANRGDAAAVERYLNAGVPVDVKSLGDMTAMRWACFSGHDEVVRLLLAHGANPSGGLLEARQMHHQKVVALLEQSGAKG